MENKSNTWFWKNEIKYEDYKKDKKKYIRFLIRIKDNDIEKVKNVLKDIKYCKKKQTIDRDKVKEFNFTEMVYDNSKSKDMIYNISCLVCNENRINEIKKILDDNFSNVIYKKSLNTITTHINPIDIERGIYTYSKENELVIKYPISIVSYKRHNEFGRTHLYLTKCKIQHHLFIEPNQEVEYLKWFNPTYCKIICSNQNFSEMSMGSTPMRNFILDYWKDRGYKKCWLLDDNIKRYVRLNNGVKNTIESKCIFTTIEDYTNNYDNVGLVSHNFSPFIREGDMRTIIVKNGKCYSSMLINTSMDIRFKYKHQEDNLISIEYINKGYSNLCFNHIMYDKNTSGIDKGGNREGIYQCKNNNTDGNGYKERYEFMEKTLWYLYHSNNLKFKDIKYNVDNFISRDKQMKSKEYHCKLDYNILKGFDNDIIKKDIIIQNILKENDFIFTPIIEDNISEKSVSDKSSVIDDTEFDDYNNSYNNIDWSESKSVSEILNNNIDNSKLIERIENLEKVVIKQNEIIEKLTNIIKI